MATAAAHLVRFGKRVPAQMLVGTGERLTLVAGDVSTAEAALPAGSKLLILRALGPIMYRFGMTGMDAAAVGDDSILFPPGEAAVDVPKIGTVYATHVRVIRADIATEDYNVQFEKVATVG